MYSTDNTGIHIFVYIYQRKEEEISYYYRYRFAYTCEIIYTYISEHAKRCRKYIIYTLHT